MTKNISKFSSMRFVSSILTFALTVAALTTLQAAGPQGKTSRRYTPADIMSSPHNSLMNINNIAMWCGDNGLMERRPQDNNAGTVFPRGTSTMVYAGGLVWGGMVHDGSTPALRVGGQTYNYGTVPGRIVTKGVAENPDGPDVRIFRIRRDYETADLSHDAAEFFDIPLANVGAGQIGQIRAQYKKDWLEWPYLKGAPYYDRNHNGVYDPDPTGKYDPNGDEPGVGGADQVVWFVANDLDISKARGLYGSPPVGMEMQVTLWGYARSDELGNVLFQRYRIIYKGTATTPANATIDSMYIAKWVDPDLGDYGDDYAGCVQDKSLGFVYNSKPADAEYAKFGLVPPVVGYDFFEGPRVPGSASDSSRFDFRFVKGYKPLPMTTFGYFAAGGLDSDPDLATYDGTLQWYNMLNGYRPRPISPPACFTDPTIQSCTNFELSGDPNTLRGWIDGRRDPPGDRRMFLASGPFSMALGDTQEVVVGLLGAVGKDYLDGINVLKTEDDVAQDAFNLNFDLPSPVPSPNLRIVELDNHLILDWESDTARTRKIEEYNSKGYRFETYNVYQFPLGSSTVDQAKLLPPFDVTGPRSLLLGDDKLKATPLVNGQHYYYAVTATVYNPDPTLVKRRLESQAVPLRATPHSPDPGYVYHYEVGDTVATVTNTIGINDAVVDVINFDPSKPDRLYTYDVLFHVFKDASRVLHQQWDFIDEATSDTLFRRVEIVSGSEPQRLVTRGFTVNVSSPPPGVHAVNQTKYAGQPSEGSVFSSANTQGTLLVTGVIDPTTHQSSLSALKGGSIDERDIEWRFGDSSWALIRRATPVASKWTRVPYTAWQMGRSAAEPDRQLYTVITDENQDTVWKAEKIIDRPFKAFYPVSIIVDTVDVGKYFDDAPTHSGAGARRSALYGHTGISSDPGVAITKAYLGDLDGDGVPAPAGTTIRFLKYKAIKDGDLKKVVVLPVDKKSLDAAREEIKRVNVFPNPYYGVNTSELSRYARYVTFNHLPAKATVRIFNLGGDLVRTIQKDDPAANQNQFLQWDLANENGLPVASGLYLAHIEMKDITGADLGTTTLKLMIVQEQQYLESY